MPRKFREDYYRNRRLLKKQIEKSKNIKSSTERSRKCRERQKFGDQPQYPVVPREPLFVSCGVESDSVPQRAAPLRSPVELETLLCRTESETDATSARDMNVRQLIAQVEQRRPLWDRTHELRHERALIEALWEEIAIVLGQSAKNVKGKWKTLKDTYRKEAKKHVNDPDYDSTWANYQPMSFLYPQLGLENNTEILMDQNSSNSFIEQEPKIEIVYENIEPLVNGDSGRASSSRKGVKRKYAEEEDDCKEKERKDEEEDMCFFRSLVPHLKQLSPQKKMLMRIRMQEMVYKEVYSPNI